MRFLTYAGHRRAGRRALPTPQLNTPLWSLLRKRPASWREQARSPGLVSSAQRTDGHRGSCAWQKEESRAHGAGPERSLALEMKPEQD